MRSGRGIVPILVIGGLSVSAALSLTAGVPDAAELPGVALGSPGLLVLERVMVAFAAWLALLTVVTEAIRGRLPVEVSGQGVRYASAEATEDAVREVRGALRDNEASVEAVRRDLTVLRDRIEREQRG